MWKLGFQIKSFGTIRRSLGLFSALALIFFTGAIIARAILSSTNFNLKQMSRQMKNKLLEMENIFTSSKFYLVLGIYNRDHICIGLSNNYFGNRIFQLS